MNQISDIIVNQYEAGWDYQQDELRSILDLIVEVVDCYEGVEGCRTAGGALRGKRLSREAELEIRKIHSRPVVSARIQSDDQHAEAAFYANRWLSQASDAEISSLAAIGWGGDIEADAVAYFMEPLDLPVEQVLDYTRTATQLSPVPIGFEVHLDEAEALAWLAAHKSELLKGITKAA